MLVEPPKFLLRLLDGVLADGATATQRRFHGREELAGLSERAVVNCTGLGSSELFDDGRLVPIRGQLVHLEPQELPYLLSHSGYLFPRGDAVVLGGTMERGATDATPVERSCRRILGRHRRFFDA